VCTFFIGQPIQVRKLTPIRLFKRYGSSLFLFLVCCFFSSSPERLDKSSGRSYFPQVLFPLYCGLQFSPPGLKTFTLGPQTSPDGFFAYSSTSCLSRAASLPIPPRRCTARPTQHVSPDFLEKQLFCLMPHPGGSGVGEAHIVRLHWPP